MVKKHKKKSKINIHEEHKKLRERLQNLEHNTVHIAPNIHESKRIAKIGHNHILSGFNKPEEQEEVKKEIIKNEKSNEPEINNINKEEIIKDEEVKEDNSKVLENYEIEVDKAKVIVKIKKGISGVIYELNVPDIGIATAALLNDIRNELVSVTTVSMKEITDPTAFNEIKRRFMAQAASMLKEKLPTVNPDMQEFLVGKLMQDMLGLGEIEFLINDSFLEEIVLPSAKESIRVYHKKYGWLETNLRIGREDEIINYSNIIARRVGRQITVLTPLLDAHLVTGDRVNAILYPISTKGNTIAVSLDNRDNRNAISKTK